MYANADHPGHQVLRELIPNVARRHFVVTVLCDYAEDGALLPADVITAFAFTENLTVTPAQAIQIANWINSI